MLIGFPLVWLVLTFAIVFAVAAGWPVAETQVEWDANKMNDTALIGRIAWLLILGGIVFWIARIGQTVDGQVTGAFVDSRNRYSLSRFQMAAWTSLVMSAWLAVAIVRIVDPDVPTDLALSIVIPETLLLAMGVSFASFGIATGIKSSKEKRQVSPTFIRRQTQRKAEIAASISATVIEKAAIEAEMASEGSAAAKSALALKAAQLGKTIEGFELERDAIDAVLKTENTALGEMARNDKPADAKASDLFHGESVDNANLVDFGKVQMFLVTLAVLGAYAVVMWQFIGEDLTGPTVPVPNGDAEPSDLFTVSLPILTATLVGLLTFSHGGYLAAKAPSRVPNIAE